MQRRFLCRTSGTQSGVHERILKSDESIYKDIKDIYTEINKNFVRKNKTINEIDYLNELQTHVLYGSGFEKQQSSQLEFIKKINNAKRQNLQA